MTWDRFHIPSESEATKHDQSNGQRHPDQPLGAWI